MAATATKQDKQMVSTPEVKTLFMCRRSDLRLVKVPRYPVYAEGGRKIGEHPGEAVQFQDGVFRCPPTGEAIIDAGIRVDAAELLGWLERHRLLDDLQEGFWQVDPVAPPISPEEMSAMMEACTALDETKLEAILEQERAGWGREAMIGVCEGEIARIRAVKQEMAAAQQEADAKAEPKA